MPGRGVVLGAPGRGLRVGRAVAGAGAVVSTWLPRPTTTGPWASPPMRTVWRSPDSVAMGFSSTGADGRRADGRRADG
ncbi:hypothetical protein KCH_59460 [Kitasatospora cheerisanensis KCTC 2395]|uniref:Uncharacterized protein n=1 Tax=Kitasatospora cheerisanensis KCTC 2395 TaxID=1348663 RepID=A0A066YM84_9ACTN|nr:hypothetical protein KCH_59460 [Kitasatospora cheerisanensis KCTC 2395]